MSQFRFEGNIPASKSLFNRALILQSFFSQMKIQGESTCDDVKAMQSALQNFKEKKDIFCAEAGTVLRFMALRVSREPGTWKLTGSKRLMERPHEELIDLLKQLGVRADVFKDHILIQGEGWQKPLGPVAIHREKSSQFASGLLLSSLNLPFDLELEIKTGVSEAYLQMTVQLLEKLGFVFSQKNNRFLIAAKQGLRSFDVNVEADMSSAFAIAAAGALSGSAVLKNISPTSQQPDFKFIDILTLMKIPLTHEGSKLSVMKANQIHPIDCNLNSTPDLFPVLAVLAAFAKGESRLWGAPHLAFKESNRIEKTRELLAKAGINSTAKEDGLIVYGEAVDKIDRQFDFDTDHDHRMAFAAGLLKLKGANINIQNPQVVSKSFPDFWQFLGVQP